AKRPGFRICRISAAASGSGLKSRKLRASRGGPDMTSIASRHGAAWLAALLLAGLIAAGGAAAEVVHTTAYRAHPVAGTTPTAVWRYMNAHPIIDPDDGPAYANLTHDHRLTMKTATVGGTCRVTSL